jgi:hypothetical protein
VAVLLGLQTAEVMVQTMVALWVESMDSMSELIRVVGLDYLKDYFVVDLLVTM